MTQTELGFFRELRHGDPEGPSIHDAVVDPLEPEVREAVARYLEQGSVIVATTARADDAIEPVHRDVAGINVLSDGEFVWSEDLAYYVRRYGARVPDKLLSRTRAGAPPRLSPEAIAAVAERFAPPPLPQRMTADRRDPAPRRDRVSSGALAALREECLRAGYLEGLDFHVDGFPTMVSSEYVDLDVTGGTYRVRYADMGSKRVVSVAPSLTAARRVFLDELARLAGGRGRGPSAGERDRPVSWRDTLTEDELLARFEREQQARRGTGR